MNVVYLCHKYIVICAFDGIYIIICLDHAFGTGLSGKSKHLPHDVLDMFTADPGRPTAQLEIPVVQIYGS